MDIKIKINLCIGNNKILKKLDHGLHLKIGKLKLVCFNLIFLIIQLKIQSNDILYQIKLFYHHPTPIRILYQPIHSIINPFYQQYYPI